MSANDAREWLRTFAGKHIPSNARGYKFRAYTGTASFANGLGLQVDLQPAEGKVVEKSDDWVAIKTARTEFFVCARNLMESDVEIGATVRITPYARRGFDGRRLDAPTVDERGIKTFILGETRSKLMIDKEKLKSSYLKDLIDQVENLKADDVRTLGTALVDAGGDKLMPVGYNDPDDEHVVEDPPKLNFSINTEKHDGYLVIVFDRGWDMYNILLVDRNENVLETLGPIDVFSLPEVILDKVDDGRWRIAKVEVLKQAPRKAA